MSVWGASPAAVEPSQPEGVPDDPADDLPELATVVRRLVASLFDAILMSVVAVAWLVFFAAWVFVAARVTGETCTFNGGCDLVSIAVSLGRIVAIVGFLATWAWVFPHQIGVHGATPGMSVFRLKLVDEKGRYASTAQAVLRVVFGGFATLPFVLPLVISANWVGVSGEAVTGRGFDFLDLYSDHFGFVSASWVDLAFVGVSFAVAFVPMGWMLVDRRCQSLRDKVAGVFVVVTPLPSRPERVQLSNPR